MRDKPCYMWCFIHNRATFGRYVCLTFA
jgi:hypothetical protein